MLNTVETGLARELARGEKTDAAGLLSAWYDQTFTFRLKDAGRAPAHIGAHLRRSFLGALACGASPEAQARQPCSWDPPCALDVFRREQLRGPKGDGLPKPYVIRAWSDGDDLMVALRLFGMANDWAMVAAEAMVHGIRDILPWSREMRGVKGAPEIAHRSMEISEFPQGRAPAKIMLTFLSPVDNSGSDMRSEPKSLLARLVRRVDAISRWNGVALEDETLRSLCAHAAGLNYDVTGLQSGWYHSPNRGRQKRRDPVLTGQIVISGDLEPLWPILHIGTRCHIGRHAVEGLGAFQKNLAKPEVPTHDPSLPNSKPTHAANAKPGASRPPPKNRHERHPNPPKSPAT